MTGEEEKERRRIDGAVVAAERHLAQVGHLAMASLVQDLAGLGIGLRIELGRLRGGERAKHAPRHRWIHPQHEHGRDDAVATKDGAEPGDASIRIGTEIGPRDQGVYVRGGSAGDFIEQIVGRRDGGDLSRRGAACSTRIAIGEEEIADLGRVTFLTGHSHEQGRSAHRVRARPQTLPASSRVASARG